MKKHIEHSVQIQIVLLSFLLVCLIILFRMLFSPTSTPPITPPPIIYQENQPIVLRIGTELPISSGISLKLIESTKGPEACRDCIEHAAIEVRQGDSIVMLEFKFGGIVGYMIDKQTAFGYEFTVTDLDEGRVVVEYTEVK